MQQEIKWVKLIKLALFLIVATFWRETKREREREVDSLLSLYLPGIWLSYVYIYI